MNRAQRRAAGFARVHHLRRIRSMIAEHGFMVQGVSADLDTPGWVYTIGLHAAGLPELILIGGMCPEDQHHAIDDLARRMLAGSAFEPGHREPEVVDGYDVTFLEVIDPTCDWLAIANLIQSGYRALQVVWPDRDGRFPWEDGYSVPRDAQPLLGLP